MPTNTVHCWRGKRLMKLPQNEQVPGVLAIDAGNSKTDVALVALDGTVLRPGRRGGDKAQRGGGF